MRRKLALGARGTFFLAGVAALVAPFLGRGALAGEEPEGITSPSSLKAWMPMPVTGYVELREPGERLAGFLASPLGRGILETGVARHLRANDPELGKFLRELERFEATTGREPLAVARDLFGQEVLVGGSVASGEPRFVVLARSRGADELRRALDAVRSAVVERVGLWPFVEAETYRGVPLHIAGGKIAYAVMGDVFAAANDPGALRKVIDLSRGAGGPSVARSEEFRRAVGETDSAETIAVGALRARGLPGYDLPEKAENFVGGFLAGGWLAALRESDLLRLEVRTAGNSLLLDFASFLDGEVKDLASFFPVAAPSRVAEILDGTSLAVLRLRRDLAAFWAAGERLVDPQGLGEMRQFAQVMNVVFAGRSFQDEVLPEFLPTVTLVVRPQSYAELAERPRPAIPGIAGILEMKAPDEFGRHFVAALQTVISLMNIDQAQKGKGRGLMLLETEELGGATIHTVSRERPREVESPGMEYNFTPSLALVGKNVVLSSSRELCRVIAEKLSPADASESGTEVRAGDLLFVDADAVERALRDNFEVIVSRNMIHKAQSREEAARELEGVLELLDFLRDLRVESGYEEGVFRSRLELRTDGPQEKGSPGESGRKRARL